jgi:hypothetical protein
MNRDGNALIGFLVLAGLAWRYPVPAAILGGLFLLEVLIHQLTRAAWNAYRTRPSFRYLTPVEQALRRGSQGFALMAFAVLGVVAPYFWAGSLSILGTAGAWPLLLFCGLFVVGATRFFEGFKGSAGARSATGWLWAAGCCGLGVVALVYLARLDLCERLGPPLGDLLAAAALAGPLWLALVGFMRLLLLSWPRGSAFDSVDEHISDTEFDWDGE